MSIHVKCPKCGAGLRAEDSMAGRAAKCARCGAGMRLPELQPAPEESGKVAAPEPATTPAPRGPRPDKRRRPIITVEEHIESLERQNRRMRRAGAVLVLATIAGAFLLWAVWPSPGPADTATHPPAPQKTYQPSLSQPSLRSKKCSRCGGSGKSKFSMCYKCKGSGVVRAGGSSRRVVPCPRCEGRGFDKCPECDGKGMVQQ